MRRREFIVLLSGAPMGSPLTAGEQQFRKMPRIGVLWHAGSAEEEAPYLGALRQGFADLGYVSGMLKPLSVLAEPWMHRTSLLVIRTA
jgi:putative ABC transport system substrate-binding protein